MLVPEAQFTAYLDAQLAERGWTMTDLITHSGLASSVIFRYRRGFQPTISNARTIAHTLQVPLLDVLVASGVLTRAEAQRGLSEVVTETLLAEVSTVELAQEQLNRAQAEQEQRRNYEAQHAGLMELAEKFTHWMKPPPEDTPPVDEDVWQEHLLREAPEYADETD